MAEHHSWPPDLPVPESLSTGTFTLRMLSETHTALDYEAVMETRERLRSEAPNGWPREGFTIEENRADLVRHEQEFRDGVAFAYTVLDPAEQRVLGCVYINPPRDEGTDAAVHLWARESEYASGLAYTLYRVVNRWLENTWGFSNVGYHRTAYFLPQGRCLCGAVTFEVADIVGPFELCHCTRCRRSSGCATSAGLVVDGLRFIQGREHIARVTLPLLREPPPYSRCFCRICGSPTPDPDTSGPQEVAAGTLEGFPKLLQRHIYVEHRVPWHHIPVGCEAMTADEIRRYRARQAEN